MNTHLQCSSSVGVECLSRLVCSIYYSAGNYSHFIIQWSQPRQRLMTFYVFSFNVGSSLRMGVHMYCVMAVLDRFLGCPQWRHSGLGRYRISTSEFMYLVVQASSSFHFIARFTNSLGAGHISGSRGSSTLSENSAVPISVKKTRPKRQLSDEDIWEWTDAKIIGTCTELVDTSPHSSHCPAASQKTWRSTTYSHYNVSLERCHQTRTLSFRFTCQFDPIRHPSITRRRVDTSQGTSNLEWAWKKCQQLHGKDASSGAPPPCPTYSHSKHHALIATRCASSRRPFNSVSDPYYIQEVQMLCPEATLPSPQTVSRDVLAMYLFGAEAVREYFSVCNSSFIGALVLTNHTETQRCCSSRDGWVDVTDLGMLSRYCGYLVLSWSDTPVHFRVCQVEGSFPLLAADLTLISNSG